MIGLHPIFKDHGYKAGFFEAFETVTGLKILPFSCGRAAMLSGLRALGLGRMDEILVPPFMCGAVLSALYRTCFPTMTASGRTKAILVFHQFGFPQDLDAVETVARKNDWIILNDCANTLFTRLKGKLLLEWGDFSIISLPKLYDCGLGGGLYSKGIYEKVLRGHEKLACSQADKAEQALEKLIKVHNGGDETVLEICGLHGYLPELAAFPQKSYSALPSTQENIIKEFTRRKNLWLLIKEIFPDRVPMCKEDEEIIPFAIPICGDEPGLEKISSEIKEKLSMEVPILHFDFARNMLKSDYRKSLVIGCHQEWSLELVKKVCKIVKTGFEK